MSRLIRAVSHGKLKKVKNQNLVNSLNLRGQTALMVAIESNAEDIADILLRQSNIDVNIGMEDNYCASTCAINANNEKIACKIIKHHNGNPNTSGNDNNNLLFYTISKHFSQLVYYLFKCDNLNYDIELSNNKQTIFHICLQILNDIIQSMKKKKLDTLTNRLINQLDNGNKTALWLAIEYNNYNMANELLQNGNCDINKICLNSQTVLHLIYSKFRKN